MNGNGVGLHLVRGLLALALVWALADVAWCQQEIGLLKDPDRIAEVGAGVAFRVFPRSYQPGLTTKEQAKEERSAKYPVRPTGDAGVIRFGSDEVVDISCPTLDQESLPLKWLGMFQPGEIHTLCIAPNRLATGAVDHVRHMQVARLQVGFKHVDEVVALRAISRRLEDIYLYEVPNGLFELRKDVPKRVWTDDEYRQLLRALKDVVSSSTLKSVKLTLGELRDEVAVSIAANKNIEFLYIRGPGSKLSDRALDAVTELPALRECILDLGPLVTGAGIELFGKVEKLERLELHGISENSRAAIERLRKLQPQTEIVVAIAENR